MISVQSTQFGTSQASQVATHLEMDKSFKEMDPTAGQPRTPNDLDNERDCASLEPPPPQVDGGKDAWCFLAAVFLFEAVIWGL